MSGEDEQAAKSIRALLAEDPSNPKAQEAFRKLLAKATQGMKQGDDAAAGKALSAALIASGAPDEIAQAIQVGITHLSEKRYAEAERGFSTALEIAKDSQVAKTGHDIARARRGAAEKDALRGLGDADPIPHAKILQASLLVEPGSKTVARGLDHLLDRAKRVAGKGDDAELARVLDAAALLEGLPSDKLEAMSAAGAHIAQARYSDAEAAFGALNGDDEDASKSKVAGLGEALSRRRRIDVLKGELAAAEKAGDVLLASSVVEKILALDPNDANTKRAAAKYSRAVIDKRLQAAQAQKDLGQLGGAYLYLKRVLALDPNHSKAKADLAGVEEELKKRLDLVVLVDRVARAPGVQPSACKGFEELLREQLMTQGADRRDLGGWVLDPAWTDAVEKKAADAPKVGGVLAATVTKCQSGSSMGQASLQWVLKVPAGGKTVVEKTVAGEVPQGALPRDEQDGEGLNARKALAKNAAEKLLDQIVLARSDVDLWLLTLAEHAMEQKDAAAAADAFVRLLVKKPSSFDPKRAATVEAYLDGAFQ